MKKLLFLIVLFSLQGYGQKTFEVYNYTSFTFELYNIITDASGNYPEFHSKGTTVSVPPGGTYTLVNPANVLRFPFHSPSSVPYIGSWIRMNPPSNGVIMTSIAAWTLGNPQVFSRMDFGSPGAGGGVISTTTPVVNGPSWIAIYDMYVNPTNPNIINYTIVIF